MADRTLVWCAAVTNSIARQNIWKYRAVPHRNRGKRRYERQGPTPRAAPRGSGGWRCKTAAPCASTPVIPIAGPGIPLDCGRAMMHPRSTLPVRWWASSRQSVVGGAPPVGPACASASGGSGILASARPGSADSPAGFPLPYPGGVGMAVRGYPTETNPDARSGRNGTLPELPSRPPSMASPRDEASGTGISPRHIQNQNRYK